MVRPTIWELPDEVLLGEGVSLPSEKCLGVNTGTCTFSEILSLCDSCLSWSGGNMDSSAGGKGGDISIGPERKTFFVVSQLF